MSDERLSKLIGLYERPALWIALRVACENPQRELRVETPYVDVGQARNMDSSHLGVSAFEPGALSVTDRMRHFECHHQKWRFLKVYDRRVVRREQTPANQFVAYFVRYSIKLLKSTAYGQSAAGDADDLFPEFLRIIRRLNAVWDGLSSEFKYAPMDVLALDNQYLQFDPHYHVILETYLACESL